MSELGSTQSFTGGRRAELTAAARALQTWLYDRRAEWADGPELDEPEDLAADTSLLVAAPITIPVLSAVESDLEIDRIRELAVEALSTRTPKPDRTAALRRTAAALAATLRQTTGAALAGAGTLLAILWSLRAPLGRGLNTAGRGLRIGGAIAIRGVSGGAARLMALRTPLAAGAARLGDAASAAGPAVAGHVGALGKPLMRWAWRAVVTAAVVAAVAGVGWPALRYWQSLPTASVVDVGSEPPPSDATARGRGVPAADGARGRGATGATGRLRITSEPAGARVLVDGRPRGVTPLDVDGLRPGSHAIVLESDKGTVRRSVSIRAGDTTELAESIYAGWVHVSSPIELQLSAGGRGLRLDDRNQVLLPPGSHELQFENRDMGFVGVRHVEVEPGKIASISVVPPPSTLSVTSTAPATVLVDGSPIGETPLVDYGILLGTHEITVRNADGAERRFTVMVTTRPVQLSAEF